MLRLRQHLYASALIGAVLVACSTAPPDERVARRDRQPQLGELQKAGAAVEAVWEKKSWRGNIPITGQFIGGTYVGSIIGVLEFSQPVTNLDVLIDTSGTEIGQAGTSDASLLVFLYTFAGNIKVYRAQWQIVPRATVGFNVSPFTARAASSSTDTGGSATPNDQTDFSGNVGLGWGLELATSPDILFPNGVTNLFVSAIAHGREIP
jgi:hypothetical protein